MKKFFTILLAVVFAMAVLTGCGGSASSAPAKDYNINDVKTAIEGANAIANPLEMDEFTLEFDLGLTMENIAEFVGVKSNDQGNSGTILVIKAAEGKASDVAASWRPTSRTRLLSLPTMPSLLPARPRLKTAVW